ncbi:15.8g4 protein [Bracoviriform inaniti]|uniref:15.8g4 protein n=1 Tax=Bracoviriform inaniti TaxID=36344 RepID=A8E0Z3_9VIRU|nr:15.8g4 protein [Bracoviriform inaniti]CAO98963.1 15.8g4 protein [Bracoviriform inaniti]
MRQHLKSDVDLTVILRLSAPRKPKDSNMLDNNLAMTRG